MAETVPPKDMSELLAEIDREWMALIRVVDQLSPGQTTVPDGDGWSPKDQLAHLAEWMKSLIGYHFDRRPWHEVLAVAKQLTDAYDFDGINAILFERNRHRPLAEVLSELKSVYAELMAKLNPMPFEELLKPRFPDDPQKRPVLNWVLSNTSEHFAEHRETIEKML